MMLLNVLQEVCGEDSTKREKYDSEIKWSIKKVLTHLQVRTFVELTILWSHCIIEKQALGM